MHSALIQAAAAERIRDHHARAAAHLRAARIRRVRRPRPARGTRLVSRVLRAA
jgi:hypothetical protein